MLAACCTVRNKFLLKVAPTKRIVAVIGHPLSGKTTVADFISKECGFTLLSLKKPIRDAMASLGIEEETRIKKHRSCLGLHVTGSDPVLKKQSVSDFQLLTDDSNSDYANGDGVQTSLIDTPNYAFHTDFRGLTDFAEFGFKEMFGNDVLLHKIKKQIEKSTDDDIVIDDLTNDHEAEFMKRNFRAYILKITRPGFESSNSSIKVFDHHLVNNKSLKQLKTNAKLLFK